MRGVCDVCGCTDFNACSDPVYGNCWWANDEQTLCSHCADVTNKNSLEYFKLREAGEIEEEE